MMNFAEITLSMSYKHNLEFLIIESFEFRHLVLSRFDLEVSLEQHHTHLPMLTASIKF